MRKRLVGLVLALTACASASPPPGGPEDKIPPKLLHVTPDTSSINVHDENATFQFDETINDRGTGDQELENYFLVSPSDGRPRVYWHRNRIDVRPRHGFRPNTAYTITLLPGLTDLRANRMKTGASVVFSTGPVIPPGRINGTVFDWVAERVAPRAYMEAMTPDSIVYLAQADTMGRFSIGPLFPGTYLVRAILDANNNRLLDRNELFDTVRVTVPQGPPLEMLAALRDTLPARMLTVSVADSMKLTVAFDRLLDPTQTITPAAFRLVSGDSSVLPILAVLTPRQQKVTDSLAAKAKTDSARIADSVAGKKPPAPLPAPAAVPGRPAPPPPPKPSRTPPFTSITLQLGAVLPPNKPFRLSETGVRGLSGRADSSARSFTTPKPPPPPKPDTAAAKPGTPAGAAKPVVPPAIQ